jgi:uroporphyrin-III C-methyltransferase/precorrin-2 dehydrogenase/sirohydrochlorin ferrochelatase
VITGTLEQLTSLIEREQVQSPALLVIGEVVSLQPKLAWYGQSTAGNSTRPALLKQI